MRFWFKPVVALLGTLLLLNLAVNAANYRTFGSFTKSELTESNSEPPSNRCFESGPSATTGLSRFPTMRSRKPTASAQLSRGSGRNSKAISVAILKCRPTRNWAWTKSERPGSCGRCAALPARRVCTKARPPRTAFIEMSPMRSIAPAMKAGFPAASLFPVFSIRGRSRTFATCRNRFRESPLYFCFEYRTMEGRDDDILTESQRALYDEMTYAPPATRPLEFSTALENFIGRYHRFLVMGLADGRIRGGPDDRLALPATASERPTQRRADCFGSRHSPPRGPFSLFSMQPGGSAAMIVIFSRSCRYTSCFLILLIYQAFALPRRAALVPATILPAHDSS